MRREAKVAVLVCLIIVPVTLIETAFTEQRAAATAAGPLFGAQSRGAPQATPRVSIVRTGHFSPIVADLDRASAFYRDVLGLQIAATPPATWDAEPWLRGLHGTPDLPIRFATAAIPGVRWGVEMVEFKDDHRRTGQSAIQVQDPGACTLLLVVRDVDAMFARIKQAGTPVVTTGGAPVDLMLGDRHFRAVIVRDPDGHFIEFVQPTPLPPTTAPAGSNVIGAGVRITVTSAERSLSLYRDQLGVDFTVGSFAAEKSAMSLLGISSGKMRMSTATLPGGTLWELLEVDGVGRKPIAARVQDPGSTRFQLMVTDLDAALAAFNRTGGAVVSLGGKPVVENGVPYAFVRDLNGIFFVVWKART